MTERIETAGETDLLAHQFAQDVARGGVSKEEVGQAGSPTDDREGSEPVSEREPPETLGGSTETESVIDDEAGPELTPESDADGADGRSTIAPPAGMSEIEKAAFSELPEDLRRFVAGQEAERTVAHQRKTRELTEMRRETEALQAELSGKLARQVEALQAVTAQELAPPDPALKKQDPERYEAELARYLHGKHEQERSQALLSAAAEELAQEQLTAYRRLMAEEAARLPALVPEMADPARAEKLTREIRAYALEQGYSENELVHAKARDVSVLHRAMLFDRAQAARSKVERKARRAPKSQKPGTAKSGVAGERQRFAELLDRHNKAGSVSTMAALFEENLRGQAHG